MSNAIERATDVNEFISEIDVGIFSQKLGIVLSDAALGVIHHAGAHCKKAKVNIEFTIEQLGENNQVIIGHKLGSVIPTKRGKKSEEDTTTTPFFVGKGGKMTITPPKEEDSGQFNLRPEKDGDGNVKLFVK